MEKRILDRGHPRSNNPEKGQISVYCGIRQIVNENDPLTSAFPQCGLKVTRGHSGSKISKKSKNYENFVILKCGKVIIFMI